MRTSHWGGRIAALLLLVFTLHSFFIFTPGQRLSGGGRQAVAKVPVTEGTQSCEGWKGRVTYVQNVDQEGFRDKGQYGYEKTSHVIKVEAEIVSSGNGSGSVKVTELHKDVQDSEDRRRADCGGGLGQSRPNTFVEKYNSIFQSSGQTTGSTPVNVHVDERGNYNFDISLPPAKGTQSMTGKHSQKGYCNADADNEENTPATEQPRTFDSVRVYAEGKMDPKNPNVVKGSVKYDPDITITWDLVKASGECEDGGLNLADLKLEQHVFPNKTAWEDAGGSTVDGNQVKITATVSNGSKKSKSGTVVIKENKSGKELTSKSVSLAPGAQTTVEYLWDTSGYAWSDTGTKASDREIEATVSDDSLRQEITVVPKPVVLVHGLWSSAAAWSNYQAYLDTYNDEWKAFPVGADPQHGIMNTGVMGTWAASNTIFQNAQELGKQIKFTQESMNAWHVDLVAHSMGGLISRYYIHAFMPTDSPDSKPYITHLVMLGTPNMGSPCADLADGLLDPLGKRVEALKQLEPGEVAKFNAQTTNRKGVKFSILVGVFTTKTCGMEEEGDIVVPVSSAQWEINDSNWVNRIHTGLTGQQDFEQWVKPHLAIGPKKAASQAAVADARPFVRGLGDRAVASLDPAAGLSAVSSEQAAGPKVTFSKNAVVKPGESVDIPVTFASGVRSGVTFLSSPSFNVSLVNADGEVVSKIDAGSEEAAQMFKTFDGKPGDYVLRFENTGERTESVFAAAWSSSNTLEVEFAEVEKQADGSVRVLVKVLDRGSAVKGAIVTLRVDQAAVEMPLFDDGKHGDGEADDGVFGGSTEKLAEGSHLVRTKAVVGSMTAGVSVVVR